MIDAVAGMQKMMKDQEGDELILDDDDLENLPSYFYTL